ncbi:MAG: hypothetical protein RSC99_05480 [Clostridiales bacterium]
MKNLYQEYKKIVLENPKITQESYEKAYNYMENSTARYHGEAVDFLYIPKIYTAKALDFLNEVAKTIYQILDKVIKEYKINPTYRKLFGFPEELEKWLLLPSQFPCTVPLCRLDLFFNEDDFSFKFCEFNADGASAMNKDREIFNAVSQTAAFKSYTKTTDLQPFELFQSWVDEFINIYKTTPQPKEKPFIAIVDFLESGTTEEFKIFQKTFIKNGYPTKICDIRTLKFDGTALYTQDGEKIDAIYRRAVTGELLEKAQEARAFLQGVKDGKVCLIGALSTQIIHNKILFSVLRTKETKAFLTAEEWEFVNEHIPLTLVLDDFAMDNYNILSDKDKWIIKPQDLYGSRGVYAGIDHDSAQWRNLVKAHKNQGYLLQEYCTAYVTENVEFTPEITWSDYNNITGLYLYNAQLKGIYSRVGKTGVISSLHQGRTMTSVLAKNKRDLNQ